MSRALILLNLGSPEKPEPAAVGAFLKEFLMDPLVLDVPWLVRKILVDSRIVPQRSITSAQAYASIWTEAGSPLMVHTADVTKALAKSLGADWQVTMGMRYGSPSLAATVQEVVAKNPSELWVLPLYPQYAQSSTETALVALKKLLKQYGVQVPTYFLPEFYQLKPFIKSFAQKIKAQLEDFSADQILFSFHGLPEHHIRKMDKTRNWCLVQSQCCDQMREMNKKCYRAQCFDTAREIAWAIGWPLNKYQVAFQSRLGSRPWIKPYSDELIQQMGSQKLQRLLVVCPSFVTDCLETLEEVAIRSREQFRAAGGGELKLVPSLNAEPYWVDAIKSFLDRSQVKWQQVNV